MNVECSLGDGWENLPSKLKNGGMHSHACLRRRSLRAKAKHNVSVKTWLYDARSLKLLAGHFKAHRTRTHDGIKPAVGGDQLFLKMQRVALHPDIELYAAPAGPMVQNAVKGIRAPRNHQG